MSTTIIPQKNHIHHELLETKKSRDFHTVAITIYNTIPEAEREKHTYNFNSMITTWHYQPAETWNIQGGIWDKMGSYLCIHFPDTEKYHAIASIFNHR
jgi:hypothetical protein|tara:strand:+ start:889 stop:1182 length:294 start_codon:yes stop_codon:yes gene_type:complete